MHYLSSAQTLLRNVGIIFAVILFLIFPGMLSGGSGEALHSLNGLTSQHSISSAHPMAIATRFDIAPPASFLLPVMPQSQSMVATYAGDCTTPKTVFNLQDTDKTVCAKVSGARPGWRVIWSNANFIAVQTNTLTQSDQDVTFTLNANSNLGDWRVIVFEPIGGTVQAVTSFTVVDAANPVADVIVSKSEMSSQVAAGTQALFNIQVSNLGPSDAENVTLTDVVPSSTTFDSFAQLSGPVFSCQNPAAGSTGTTVCTIAALQKGETVIFTATYVVDGGATSGSRVENTATVSSDTTDQKDENNSSTASIEVSTPSCILTCAANITVGADSGQAGALVTFADPGSAGDCGQPTTGEGGEVIPAISCNPASGSFFPVGTSTVICASQTGAFCSFQVTVENPGGLSITLNGANPFSLECGEEFSDPGASAVNGTGQSVEVTVSGTVDSHTAGSYTLTYTATEDPNSVSTTRTVVVADNAAPVITIEGPNPMTTSCGQPFVDPGVSAIDNCEGSKSVSSSGTVDQNTPGTYTITYTATDSHNHTATATRTVIVESGANAPPTISLNGGPHLEIECGTPFTDPGATAVVPCGGAVPVTVSGTVNVHAPGTYTLTYTACVEDQPGHCDPALTSQAERTVEVTADATAPTITLNGPNPLTVECHGTFTDPGAVAHDACAGDFAATASGSVNPNVVGQYTITYNATDPSGHAAAPVTRTVNVVDTTAPVVTPPPNVSVSTGSGASSCSTVVSDAVLGSATASDACNGGLSVSRSGVPAGNVFPVGQTTITYSATDASQNTGTATQIVTVVDNTPPTISCPANIVVEPTCPSGAFVNYPVPVGTDNCAGAITTRTAGLASGSIFPIGTTTVTYSVTDAAGNGPVSCSFTVTVLTPAQVVQNLINTVNGLSSLTGTQRQGLLSKLNAALTAINQGQTNVACNKLADFISQVQSFINNGTLTPAVGQPLINSAAHVRNTLGCTSLGCT
jgi:uncharacterized repeat protein (TIGR01451 family)